MTRLRRAADAVPASRRRAVALVVLILSIAIATEGLVFAGAAAGATIGTPVAPSPTFRPEREPAAAFEKATGEARPGIQYDEAMAHENDRIAFVPGDRVTVPFRPRSGDKWSVGGRAPRALPAGHASGRAMAASVQGSRWAGSEPVAAPAGHSAPAGTPAPVDAPALDPSDVVPATGASVSQPSPLVGTGPQNAGLLRQVFGFLPYWEVQSATLNYDVLSTIAYFSVGSDAQGNLLKRNADGTLTTGWGGWTSSAMTSIINRAHQKRTRVVLTISVFAWSTAQANKQRAILGSPTARLNLARQAAAAVRDRGADGINLDFEPIATGYADEFTAFVRTVRAELNKIAAGYQLTFDTTGWISNYPVEAATAAGAADAIFIMGYDYRTGGANPVGSLAPLTGPAYDLTDTIRAYVARVPASKLILGVPYYGRAWSTDSNQLHATNTSGTKYGASTTVVYEAALDYAVKYGRRWDAIEQAPWIAYTRENCTATYGCITSWRQIYYDDAASLGAKYDLINRYALRGAGIWALGYDGARPELNAVLARKFLHDTTAPLVGIRNMATLQHDAGFTVSWAGQDISGIRSYDVQYAVDGGAWRAWLTATTKKSDVFVALQGHGYAFRARGIDNRGNTSTWNVTATWDATPSLGVATFGLVRSDGLNTRTAPDTSAPKVGTLNSGDLVRVVGGPRTADGYTWWQVSGPVLEWQPVSPIDVGFWVAAGTSADPWLVAAHAPSTTFVDPVIRDFHVGDSSRAFSPNGDGSRDALRISWTNAQPFSSLGLDVYGLDGALVGTIALGNLTAGAQAYDWNGMVNGMRVADGRYILALRGTSGGLTYHAPSATPVTGGQLALFGVTVDTAAPAAGTPSVAIVGSRYDITSVATRVRMAWPKATDATSGVAGYDVQTSRDGAAWVDVTAAPPTTSVILVWVEFGHRYVYRVRARDAAGNASPWQPATALTVAARDDKSSVMRYGGPWSSVTSASAFGGSFHRTTSSSSSVTFSFTGRQLAIISRMGPGEGSAAVYVNGVYQGTFSTYATTTLYRRSEWTRDFGTSAARTITIRALGTAGHPGVNVDAILVGR